MAGTTRGRATQPTAKRTRRFISVFVRHHTRVADTQASVPVATCSGRRFRPVLPRIVDIPMARVLRFLSSLSMTLLTRKTVRGDASWVARHSGL